MTGPLPVGLVRYLAPKVAAEVERIKQEIEERADDLERQGLDPAAAFMQAQREVLEAA